MQQNQIKEVKQQLQEYRQFLLRIRTHCTTDEQRVSFDNALAQNDRCSKFLDSLEPSPQLKQWEKGQADAMKDWNPPAWHCNPKDQKGGVK